MAFLDIGIANLSKRGQLCSGDITLSRRSDDGRRLSAVLCDGLGSGLQANTAASLTGTMALEYITADVEIRHAARMIMDALPLCPERHISYSTFTMLDAQLDGDLRLIEYGNPAALLFREDGVGEIPRTSLTLSRWDGRTLTYSTFRIELGERIIFCSDGVTQAGLGSAKLPFGWGRDKLTTHLQMLLSGEPDLSANDLSALVVQQALGLDNGQAGDDITCCVVHSRNTRVLQVLTGPPFDRARDAEFAGQILNQGTKSVVCGGTTAELVGRELGRPLAMSLAHPDPSIPATSEMEGAALVTEGCITLSAVAEMLERGEVPRRRNGATRLCNYLLQSDKIVFFVGTGVNLAHHDPRLPVELELRRTLVRRIKNLLESRYFKQVEVQLY